MPTEGFLGGLAAGLGPAFQSQMYAQALRNAGIGKEGSGVSEWTDTTGQGASVPPSASWWARNMPSWLGGATPSGSAPTPMPGPIGGNLPLMAPAYPQSPIAQQGGPPAPLPIQRPAMRRTAPGVWGTPMTMPKDSGYNVPPPGPWLSAYPPQSGATSPAFSSWFQSKFGAPPGQG